MISHLCAIFVLLFLCVLYSTHIRMPGRVSLLLLLLLLLLHFVTLLRVFIFLLLLGTHKTGWNVIIQTPAGHGTEPRIFLSYVSIFVCECVRWLRALFY